MLKRRASARPVSPISPSCAGVRPHPVTAFTMSVSLGSSYFRKKHIPTVLRALRDGRFEFMWSPPVGLVE